MKLNEAYINSKSKTTDYLYIPILPFIARVIANIKNAIREWESTLPCLGTWQDVTRTGKPRDYMYFFRGGG